MDRSAYILLTLLFFICAAGMIDAETFDKDLSAFKKYLSKEITLELLGTPLGRVFEHLEEKAGCPIIIDRIAIGDELKKKISLESKSITIKDALDSVCNMAGLDYDVRKGRLLVSNKARILQPYLVTRFYDIRGLTIIPQDLPGPNIELMSGEGDIQIAQPFGQVDTVGISEKELKDFVKDIIPEANWDVRGVRIADHGGSLIVTNTENVQDKIHIMFLEQQKTYGKMVEFDVSILQISSKHIDGFLERIGTNILSQEELKRFRSLIDRHSLAVNELGHCRTICFNTQRIHFLTGINKAYVRDITPVIATMSGGVDPELDCMSEGFVIDVRPLVSFDDQWISLNFRGTMAKAGRVNNVDIPSPGSTYSGTIAVEKKSGAQQKKDDQQKSKKETGPKTGVSAKNPLINVKSYSRAPAAVQTPDMDIVRFRSDVRVPESGGVIFSAGSKEFHHLKDTANKEILILVSLNIVK